MSASRTEPVMVFNKWRIPMFPWDGAHDEVMVSIGNGENVLLLLGMLHV